MTHVVVICILVLDKVFVLLVDRVVGEVHAEVIQITSERRNVFFGRKASQTLFVYENSDWNHGSE